MSRFSKYMKEKLVKVLVAALVVGSVAGNGSMTVQAEDIFATASLSNPYSFAIYTNEYTQKNHVEGNVAIGALKTRLEIWRGCNFIGDFADGNASFVMNIGESALVYPQYNSDGSRNELTELTGQGYTFSIYKDDSDTNPREFVTDNRLIALKVQENIREDIAAGIEAMKTVAAQYYGRTDVDSDTELVLNLTAREADANVEKIFLAADAGKKVLVNITDSGTVSLAQQNDNWTSQRDEYADWAANIIWNFGNASRVETGRVWGYVLAPNATLHNGNNVIGGVICNVLEQGGEVHVPRPWTPREKTETETPAPTPEAGTPTPGVGTPTPEAGTPTPEAGTPTPEAGTPTPEAGTPTPEAGTPTPEAGTPTPEAGTPTPEVGTPTPEAGTPTPEAGTPTPEAGTPTPEAGTPTPEAGTPTPEVGTPTPEAGTPTPGAGTPTPGVNTPTPDTPDTPDDPSAPTPTPPVTPEYPSNPDTPNNPDTPQVLGARRRRMVTITDDPVPLADRAVLGASRRPQTGDDSDAWNLGFLFSLTGLGAWLIIKRKH